MSFTALSFNNDGKQKNNSNNKNIFSSWIATGLHPHIWGEPLAMTATTNGNDKVENGNGIFRNGNGKSFISFWIATGGQSRPRNDGKNYDLRQRQKGKWY
jgi:hypothetical protein